MRKKLSKTQKTKNARAYKQIRKEYDKIVEKFKAAGKLKELETSYLGFKHRVLARKDAYDMTLKAAIKKEANTESFTTAAERSRDNLVNMLKNDHPEAWKELRNLSRYEGPTIRDEEGKITFKKGQFIKMNIRWNKEAKRYEVNGKYYIDISNSPESVSIEEIK